MGIVVGVHGIAKHQSGRHQLLANWRPALLDGLERATGRRVEEVDLDLAFYGDLFLSSSTSQDYKGADDIDAFVEMDTHERADVEEMLSEMVTTDDPEDISENMVNDKGYTRAPLPIQLLLRALGRRFTSASAVTAFGVLRQMREYLCNEPLKTEIDQRIKTDITPDCKVLIGHSLGSVVAAEFLRQNTDHGIDLFLTLGSPLGLQFVRARFPTDPIMVPTWVNIRDDRDPVTCAGPLRTWWPQITKVNDIVVKNGRDAHSAERYLSRKTTGDALIRNIPQIIND